MPYLPTINGRMVRTLADWGLFFGKDGKINPLIELMDEEHTILDDAVWIEATDKDGNRTALRVKLPQVYWRSLYKGIPVSKSGVSLIKDPVAMLEGRSLIDTEILRLHKSSAAAYRLEESKAFTESMKQELATAIFYGNVKDAPEGVHGLAPRYAYSNSPNVVDAGGTGPNCTSIWGVVWGPREVSCIFPNDSMMGLEHRDLGEGDALDENGHAYRAVQDLYHWNVGFAVADWRCVVRIANIDTTKLELYKGDTGFVDLHRLTIKAKNKIPPAKRPRIRWYMNSEVQTALELQASDKGNVVLVRTNQASRMGPLFDSYEIERIHGGLVRCNDAILSTEEPLVPMPAA